MAQDTLEETSAQGGAAGTPDTRTTGQQQRSMTEMLGAAKDQVVAEAQALGSKAAETALGQADAVKDEAAGGLSAFSDALKAAQTQLQDKKLGFAGDMLSEAADGLAGVARSIEGRSSSEMIEAVRGFGRSNPMAFFAAAALAGFAVGRVAAAAGEGLSGSPAASRSPSSSGTADWPVAEHVPGRSDL